MMKSILRKVKTSDRLPDKKGTYHCKRTTDNAEISLYFIPDMLHYVNKFKNVDYWFEEVEIEDELDLNDIFELLPIFKDKDYTLADKISIIINKHDKGIFEDNVDHEGVINDIKLLLEVEAKERYNKALEFLDIPNWVIENNKVVPGIEVIKALKIVAGVKLN